MKTPSLRILVGALVLSLAGPTPALVAQDEDEKKEEKTEKKKKKGFRIFTGKKGKTLELRVVTRIDDNRYTFENVEGKTFTFDVKEKLSNADQLYLESWEPDAILDIAGAELSEVLAKKDYSGADLSLANNRVVATATLDGKEIKLIIDSARHFSILNPAAAKELGLTLRPGTVTFSSGGKASKSQQGTVKTLAIGDVEVSSIPFEVLDINGLFNPVPANTVGSIGGNLLKKLNAMIDYQGKRIYVREDEE